jgi:HSP20 family protein
MVTSRDGGEKRGRPGKEDLEDIIDRIIKMSRSGNFFQSEGDDVISWRAEEDEPEILDLGSSLSVTIEIPGVKREDIELFVEKDSIFLEVPDSGLAKRVSLPRDVAPKSAKATYKNGVLDVILKKA